MNGTGDPARNDLDPHAREIRIRGKGGTARTVKIGHQAARSLDRYIRARARHAQAWRPQLWLGVNNRGPLTATGIYQIVARRGRQCGVTVLPAPVAAPLQPHLAGPRRSRTGPDGTQRLDLPADARPVRRQRPRRPRPPQLRPHHGRHLTPAQRHPAAPPGQSKTLPEARRRPSDPDHDHHQSHPPRNTGFPAHSADRLLSVKQTAVSGTRKDLDPRRRSSRGSWAQNKSAWQMAATRRLRPARLNDCLVPLGQKSRRVANESLRGKNHRA